MLNHEVTLSKISTMIEQIRNKIPDRILAIWDSCRVYVIYTILFSIIFRIAFSPFWENDRTFLWNNDGVAGYFPHLHYTGRFYREVVRNIFAGNFSLPLFDFRLGLGDDVIRYTHLSIGFDFLNALSIFVPSRYTEQLFNFTVIARFYLSGLAFLRFCKYLKATDSHALIGAFAYIFGGWMLISGIRHTFFLHATIWLPIVIQELDNTLRGKKPYLFIISVFLLAMTGFYFLYVILLFFIPYVIIRIHHLYPNEWLKKILTRGVYAVAMVMTALLLAGVYLFPVIMFFLESTRVSNINVDTLVRFSAIEYLSTFMHVIGGQPGYHTIVFPALILIALMWLFFGKSMCKNENSDRKHLLALVVVVLFVRLIPAGNFMMNGFGYVSFRWSFLISFVLSIVIVKSLPFIIDIKGKLFYISLVVLFLYGYFSITEDFARNIRFLWGLAMLAVTLIILVYSQHNNQKYSKIFKNIMLLLVVVINVTVNAYWWNRDDIGGGAVPYRAIGIVNDSFVHLPDSIRQPEDFHRVDVIASQANNSFVRDYFGLPGYISVQNPYVMELLSRMESAHSVPFWIHNWDNRTILKSLTSVQYSVATSVNNINRIPYGFVESIIEEDYPLWIHSNNYFLPFGFTYTNSSDISVIEHKNPAEIQEIMMQSIILERNDSNTSIPDLTTMNIPFTYTLNNIRWNDYYFRVLANNSIHIEFEGIPNSEVYIRLIGFTSNARASASFNVISERDTRNRAVSFWRGNYYSAIHSYYVTVNMGYFAEPINELTINFLNAGWYHLDAIEILALPFDNFQHNIESLRVTHITNLNLHDSYRMPGLTSKITGEIYLDDGRYLFLSIPYSRGWRAYANGNRTPILRANIAFMALELEAGHHEIELRYRTPGLLPGAILSVLGFVIFVLVIKYHKHIVSLLDNNCMKGDNK